MAKTLDILNLLNITGSDLERNTFAIPEDSQYIPVRVTLTYTGDFLLLSYAKIVEQYANFTNLQNRKVEQIQQYHQGGGTITLDIQQDCRRIGGDNMSFVQMQYTPMICARGQYDTIDIQFTPLVSTTGNKILLAYADANPEIAGVARQTASSNILVRTTWQGKLLQFYFPLSYFDWEASIYALADPDTPITIEGDWNRVDAAGIYWPTLVSVRNNTAVEIIDGLKYARTLEIENCPNFISLSVTDNASVEVVSISNNTALTTLAVSRCNNLRELHANNNTALTSFECIDHPKMELFTCSGNTALEEFTCTYLLKMEKLDISGCIHLMMFWMMGMYALRELNITNVPEITMFYMGYPVQIPEIQVIRADARSSAVANGVAQLINQAAQTGTVYADSAADYYSTIESAANNKGWTIEAL